MALCTTQKKQSWTGSQIKSGELPRTGTWVPVVSYLEPSVWLSKYAHCVSQLELASLLLVAKSILTETQHSGEGIVIPVLQLKAQWVKCSQGVGWVRDHTLQCLGSMWSPWGGKSLNIPQEWPSLSHIWRSDESSDWKMKSLAQLGRSFPVWLEDGLEEVSKSS